MDNEEMVTRQSRLP